MRDLIWSWKQVTIGLGDGVESKEAQAFAAINNV